MHTLAGTAFASSGATAPAAPVVSRLSMSTARRRLPPVTRASGPRTLPIRPVPIPAAPGPETLTGPETSAPVPSVEPGVEPSIAASVKATGDAVGSGEASMGNPGAAGAIGRNRGASSSAPTSPPQTSDSRLGRFTRPVEAWLRRHAPGRPLHPRTLRDRALARRLHRALSGDATLAALADVRLFVASGTVAVEAVVAHDLDRDLLLRLVGSVRGVVAVIPRVTVQGTPLPDAARHPTTTPAEPSANDKPSLP